MSLAYWSSWISSSWEDNLFCQRALLTSRATSENLELSEQVPAPDQERIGQRTEQIGYRPVCDITEIKCVLFVISLCNLCHLNAPGPASRKRRCTRRVGTIVAVADRSRGRRAQSIATVRAVAPGHRRANEATGMPGVVRAGQDNRGAGGRSDQERGAPRVRTAWQGEVAGEFSLVCAAHKLTKTILATVRGEVCPEFGKRAASA